LISPHNIPIVSFVGFSGSGKTTLMTKIIQIFKQQGYRVGSIKHDAHRFEMDHKGKDTWKFSKAGSDVVVINSQEKLAMIENLQEPISFADVVSMIKNVDIIFVEGYKHESPSKILLVRRQKDLELLSQLKDVIAIVTSLSFKDLNPKIPVFDLNHVEGIVDLIQSKILGENKK